MYIIVAPGYKTNHSGIVVLYKLCDKINKLGNNAYIYQLIDNDLPKNMNVMAINRIYAEDLIKENAIVVYPEIVQDNILRAKRTVGWQLGPSPLVDFKEKFYFNLQYCPSKPDRILRIDPIDHNLFKEDETKEKKYNTVWIGKGFANAEDLSGIPNMKLITYQWPTSQEELSEILQQTKTFYTFDAYTSLTNEAVLCGCEIEFIPNKHHSQKLFEEQNINCFPSLAFNKASYYNYYKDEEMQIQRFLEVTQFMGV